MNTTTATRLRTKAWAEAETARICENIMQNNLGIIQQLLDDQTALLDTLSVEQLSAPDDLGVTPSYQAVYYEKPAMLQYLHSRGVDLSKPCDPAQFGNTMFYAVSMGRLSVVSQLDSLGYSVESPCDVFGTLPKAHAARVGDHAMIRLIESIVTRPHRAAILFKKNFDKNKARRIFLRMRSAIICIQAHIRGWIARTRPQFYANSTDEPTDNADVGSGVVADADSISKGDEAVATTVEEEKEKKKHSD